MVILSGLNSNGIFVQIGYPVAWDIFITFLGYLANKLFHLTKFHTSGYYPFLESYFESIFPKRIVRHRIEINQIRYRYTHIESKFNKRSKYRFCF